MATATVRRVAVRNFRNYDRAELCLAPGVTVISGANGAGKTNLLEAIYFGLTGRSCRTSNERELVRHGESVARVTIETEDEAGAHMLEAGFEPGESKRLRVDGALVERLSDSTARPLVSVFMPERLELVRGPPSSRRAHLDRLVAAMWPGRAAVRTAYARAGAAQRAARPRPRRTRRRDPARQLGRGAFPSRRRADGRPRAGGRLDYAGVLGPRPRARIARAGGGELSAPVERG